MKICYKVQTNRFVSSVDSIIIFDREELVKELMSLLDKYGDYVSIECRKHDYIKIKGNIIKILRFYFGN